MVSSIERFHCTQDSQLGPNGVHYREIPLYITCCTGSLLQQAVYWFAERVHALVRTLLMTGSLSRAFIASAPENRPEAISSASGTTYRHNDRESLMTTDTSE